MFKLLTHFYFMVKYGLFAHYHFCCTNYKLEFKNFQKFIKILILDKIAFLRKRAKKKKKYFEIFEL